MKWLLLALGSMFLQQSFVTLSKVQISVLAPAVVEDLGIDPSWLGVYVGIIAATGLIVQAGCGSFVVRYGALRVSQVSLLMAGLGLALGAPGLTLMFALSAIAIGLSATSTPASSHILGRYSPRKHAPLVFSIKQTAVPTGLLTAGLLGPFLTELYGWQTALVIIAAACVVFAVVLEPLRREFDNDRDLTRRFRLSDFKGTISLVLGTPDLRSLALGCFAFVGLQTVITAYFVIYLTHVGYTLAGAGQVFAMATAVAVGGRIFWGWLSSSYVAPRVMLGALAMAMGIAIGMISFIDETWAVWQVTLVAACVSATVFSWHGIMLAEASRLAPNSMRSAVTGGILSFGQFGGLLLPLLYSLILSITDSYRVGFLVCTVPALLVGLALLLSARTAKQSGSGAE